MRPVTSSQRGIIHGKSPAAVIGSARDLPVAASSSCTRPACSNTTVLPSAPDASVFTSKSRKPVTWRIAYDFVSYAHTFATPSRSLMNHTDSPTHTGSMSFDPSNGGVTVSIDARSVIQIGLFCPPR